MFSLPEFGAVQPAGYEAIGFKSGLEVHQQLLTEKKLFCRCPAGRYSDRYDAEILRHMRPTLSEMGEYDGTALMEFKTRKDIVYRLSSSTVCTYEMDDAPPFVINEQAVDIALRIALLLRLQLIDELHIARKQYLDGSIPTGFQRTTILGVNGWVPYAGRRIGVRQLGLEEDSCREVSDVGHVRTFIADRLGMPLIEIVTEPDMRTPQEVAEVGQLLRRLTRATGLVRRGIGSARQDVNVSVAGGTRVEIKGVPRLPMIPRLVHNEAYRQVALLGIRDELRRRIAPPLDWKAARADLTGLLAHSVFPPVAAAVAHGQQVCGVLLPRFASILTHTTQPHTVFLQELADRVRVIACLQGVPNLVSSDNPAATLSPGEWSRIRRRLRATAEDALVVVWGPAQDVGTAAAEIEARAVEAFEGVPSETRQAFDDGTTGFERILPGPNRMYPDTDLPPKPLPAERLQRAAVRLPARPWELEERYQEIGLSAELARQLTFTTETHLFERITAVAPGLASVAAYVLCNYLPGKRRRGRRVETLMTGCLESLFAHAAKRQWNREMVLIVLEQTLCQNRPLDQMELDALDPKAISDRHVEQLVTQVAGESQFQPRPSRPSRASQSVRRHAYLMGLLMNRLRGSVPGRRVNELLARYLSQRHSQEVSLS